MILTIFSEKHLDLNIESNNLLFSRVYSIIKFSPSIRKQSITMHLKFQLDFTKLSCHLETFLSLSVELRVVALLIVVVKKSEFEFSIRACIRIHE